MPKRSPRGILDQLPAIRRETAAALNGWSSSMPRESRASSSMR